MANHYNLRRAEAVPLLLTLLFLIGNCVISTFLYCRQPEIDRYQIGIGGLAFLFAVVLGTYLATRAGLKFSMRQWLKTGQVAGVLAVGFSWVGLMLTPWAMAAAWWLTELSFGVGVAAFLASFYYRWPIRYRYSNIYDQLINLLLGGCVIITLLAVAGLTIRVELPTWTLHLGGAGQMLLIALSWLAHWLLPEIDDQPTMGEDENKPVQQEKMVSEQVVLAMLAAGTPAFGLLFWHSWDYYPFCAVAFLVGMWAVALWLRCGGQPSLNAGRWPIAVLGIIVLLLGLGLWPSAFAGLTISVILTGLLGCFFSLALVALAPEALKMSSWSQRLRRSGRFLGVAGVLGLVGLYALEAKLSGQLEIFWVWWAFAIWGGAMLALILLRPDILLRSIVLILTHTVYKLHIYGRDRMPEYGPALLIANHVSLLDAFLVLACTPRRIRFLIHHSFYNIPALNWFFRWAGALEVPDARHPKKMQKLIEQVRAILLDGGLVCVFPEGRVTENGIMQEFHTGTGAMLPDPSIPVIPLRLGMLWGSALVIDRRKLRFIPPREVPIPATITIGAPLKPNMTAYQIRQYISEIGAETEMLPRKSEKTIHYQFACNAKRRPWFASFKDFGGKKLSNFSLLVRCLLLSKEIRKLAGDSEYVGVLLPNCTILVAVLLGTMYADKTPAVLNFTAGVTARRAAIDRSKIKLILTSRKFLDKAKLPIEPEMVFLEEVAGNITQSAKIKALLDVILLPTSLLMRKYAPASYRKIFKPAVLLFSSGSTGIPKGVMQTHHNVNCNFFSFWRVIGWRSDDRVIGNLPLFHSFGMTVGFWVSAMSGCISTVYHPNPLDGTAIGKLLETEKITLMMATPTFLQTYMRRCTREQFRHLRIVITGGEKLRQDIAEKFKALTGLSVIEGYGCTELSPIVSINLASSIFALGKSAGKFGSIGVPLPGICVKIVDPETREPVATSEPGLMLVKSGSVMKGYLNDPTATADVIEDGFYNTGDIARMDSDGYLTITGRLSRFSKISGEMVPHELLEMRINEILQTEDRCVAVCGIPDSKRGERILVFHSLSEFDESDMIEKLRASGIPNLWIPKPGDFLHIDEIPLLGSGKLDLQKIKSLAAEVPRE